MDGEGSLNVRPVSFGEYELIKKVAIGGMGEIFLARQTINDIERHVAIKRILPGLSEDDEFIKMFLDEARLAIKLSHPNIVQNIDFGLYGDQYYIAMEFLEGRNLRRVMGRLRTQGEEFPLQHALQIIYWTAEGLDYAHNLTDGQGNPLNVIHRDVSPQNIFVTRHGTIKILDFGIAKTDVRSIRTKTGGVKGKYPYLSPEQARGSDIDGRTDLFSLATVLWELTVGRRLFKRENDLLTLQSVLNYEVPRPSEIKPNYPKELEKVVMKALARNPSKRHPSCRAFQDDLEAYVLRSKHRLSPIELGRFVEELFKDEAITTDRILESLKSAPRFKSLIHTLSDSDTEEGKTEPSDSQSEAANSNSRPAMTSSISEVHEDLQAELSLELAEATPVTKVGSKIRLSQRGPDSFVPLSAQSTEEVLTFDDLVRSLDRRDKSENKEDDGIAALVNLSRSDRKNVKSSALDDDTEVSEIDPAFLGLPLVPPSSLLKRARDVTSMAIPEDNEPTEVAEMDQSILDAHAKLVSRDPWKKERPSKESHLDGEPTEVAEIDPAMLGNHTPQRPPQAPSPITYALQHPISLIAAVIVGISLLLIVASRLWSCL